MKSEIYPRDLLGYGAKPPNPKWPNNARVAVQFVVNFEEGGENCVLHGDPASEAFLSEIVGAQPLAGIRHMNMESLYEYGSRAGFWRLYRVLTKWKFPVTVFGVAMALQRSPEAIAAMQQANWEIASHGLRWIDYAFTDPKLELEHLQQALEIHKQVTGSAPAGWYVGRTSPNTRKLLLSLGKWLYDADSYADDLPYWVRGNNEPHLLIPYTLDVNDMRFSIPAGFSNGEQFFIYLRDTFDQLYQEGEHSPKMMSVGLHCRIAGKPGRALALQGFCEHIAKYDHVWVATREQIAKHWHTNFPCKFEDIPECLTV